MVLQPLHKDFSYWLWIVLSGGFPVLSGYPGAQAGGTVVLMVSVSKGRRMLLFPPCYCPRQMIKGPLLAGSG